jgi:hypothetical protein
MLKMSTTNAIDDEWRKFIQSSSSVNSDDDEDVCPEEDVIFTMPSNMPVPEPGPIYISTKSKIAYLNGPIDLNVFWNIAVIPYATPRNGIIKKQIKSNTTCIEEFERIQSMLKLEPYYEEHIITSINNPTGRIKFKDSRKITVGMSKKDIMSYRSKKKSAFYNCFVIIMRILVDDVFKEFHVKVFNTGELDIPGIQSEETFEIVLQTVIDTLQPFISYPLAYNKSSENILINSNFNCGFFINRESLIKLLRNKYNIQSIYDPCSYPGIQSKFYYNHDTEEQTGVHLAEGTFSVVSFMIFRTGSVLIVGKCDENVLNDIYAFLVKLLKTEYYAIGQCKSACDIVPLKDKKKKIRKKMITVTDEPL